MTGREPLHVLVAKALRTEPTRRWLIMGRDETGSYIGFESRYEADQYLANALAVSPNGMLARGGAHVVEYHNFPQYDTDWSATGPMIERYGIHLWVGSWYEFVGGRPGHWLAADNLFPDDKYREEGQTPLIAVCNLILTLHAAGKLTGVRQ